MHAAQLPITHWWDYSKGNNLVMFVVQKNPTRPQLVEMILMRPHMHITRDLSILLVPKENYVLPSWLVVVPEALLALTGWNWLQRRCCIKILVTPRHHSDALPMYIGRVGNVKCYVAETWVCSVERALSDREPMFNLSLLDSHKEGFGTVSVPGLAWGHLLDWDFNLSLL